MPRQWLAEGQQLAVLLHLVDERLLIEILIPAPVMTTMLIRDAYPVGMVLSGTIERAP